MAYPAFTVEIKLEIKYKIIQINMFCLLYLSTVFMTQPIQCTGLSGMAQQNYWKQKEKFTISQVVTGKADVSMLT